MLAFFMHPASIRGSYESRGMLAGDSRHRVAGTCVMNMFVPNVIGIVARSLSI